MFRLGADNGVFDAEVRAPRRAVYILDRRQESGHRNSISSDSTAAIDRARAVSVGPVQRFSVATAEVCSRARAGTMGSPSGGPGPLPDRGQRKGRQVCQGCCRQELRPGEAPDEYHWETYLSLMTRAATGAKPRTTAEWIADHVGAERPYWPRGESGLISSCGG